MPVDGTRHELFAHTTLAANQHGHVAVGSLLIALRDHSALLIGKTDLWLHEEGELNEGSRGSVWRIVIASPLRGTLE